MANLYNEKQWTRAQRRPGGDGVRCYIKGSELAKLFDGQVPAELEYSVQVWASRKTRSALIIKLREGVPLNGRGLVVEEGSGAGGGILAEAGSVEL